MNYVDLRKAKSVYESGGNVTEFLRAEFGESENTSEIIEIAYDLQAGTYIDQVEKNLQQALLYTEELKSWITPHLVKGDSLLDVGTGELTTLSLMLEGIDTIPSEVYAFDISWSRLSKGKAFWSETVKESSMHLYPFVADIKKIPLGTKSIDVVMSSHALEPNGGSLQKLLSELFRVCKRQLVLFEPSYELNSAEGKARMDRLGYVKGIEEKVKSLGGKVLDVQLVKNTGNPLNPTACYIIEPPYADIDSGENNLLKFSVPGTDYNLTARDNFFVSAETGLVFPVLQKIPVLKESASILASCLVS